MEEMQKSSRIPGFGNLSIEEQARKWASFSRLDSKEFAELLALMKRRDSPPLRAAPNFKISFNGGTKEYIVPMVIEEASVVPAVSNGAKMTWNSGGFSATYTGSISHGYIEIRKVQDVEGVERKLSASMPLLLDRMNELCGHVFATGLSIKRSRYAGQESLMLKFSFDTGDAMGANRINGMLERVQPTLASLVGSEGRVENGVLSNDSESRVVFVEANVRAEDVGGSRVAEGIAHFSEYGDAFTFRGVTNNKGIMNGVVGVLSAMDNDTRAAEAAAHKYACGCRGYGSLSKWTIDKNGDLHGELALPAPFATVGGAVGLYDQSRISRKLLSRNDEDSFHVGEFACIVGSAGLAANLAALRAHADEGIQRGHMRNFEQQKSELKRK
jgi:hydroxymethylglutaryl-CoA reductase